MRAEDRNLEALTSLRFFAASWVLLFHSGSSFARTTPAVPRAVANMLSHGWLGVPFFFILSGFILAYVYAGKGLTFRGSRNFFAARIARIYPVYLLSLLVMVPFFLPFAPLRDWQQFLMLQSWPAADVARLWDPPGWSLSVEVFFYLVFPLLLPLAERLPSSSLVALFGANCVLLLAVWLNMGIPCGGVPPNEWLGRPSLLLIVRLPEFVDGLLLGLLFRRHASSGSRAGLYAMLAIIALATASTRSFYSHAIAILAFGPLIFLIAANGKRGWLGRFLNARLLVFLGGASYAIYLFQVPVLIWMEHAIPASHDQLRRIAYTPVVLIVSMAIFQLVEKPARQALRRALGLGAESGQSSPWIPPSAESDCASPPAAPASIQANHYA